MSGTTQKACSLDEMKGKGRFLLLFAAFWLLCQGLLLLRDAIRQPPCLKSQLTVDWNFYKLWAEVTFPPLTLWWVFCTLSTFFRNSLILLSYLLVSLLLQNQGLRPEMTETTRGFFPSVFSTQSSWHTQIISTFSQVALHLQLGQPPCRPAVSHSRTLQHPLTDAHTWWQPGGRGSRARQVGVQAQSTH